MTTGTPALVAAGLPERQSTGQARRAGPYAVAVLLAAVLRVALVAESRHTYRPVDDALDFSRIAHSIATGHGFGPASFAPVLGPSAFRTPLWPGALSAVYAATGSSVTSGRLLAALLGTLLVALIGVLSTQLLGRRVGIVATFVAAVDPMLILGGYGLNYEPLLGVCVIASLVLALRWCRAARSGWGGLVVIGVLVGLAALCRENAALVALPVAVLVWRAVRRDRGGSSRRAWGSALLVPIVGGLVILPWTIRNAVRLHAFVPVSDSPQYAVAGTYNAYSAAHDAKWIPPDDVPQFHAITARLAGRVGEVHFVDAYERAALTYVGHHPAYVLRVVFWNTVRFLDLRGPTDANWLSSLIPWPVWLIETAVVGFYVLAAVALIGLCFRDRLRTPRILWTFPLLWALTVVVSAAIMQYRFVWEPFVILLAARALCDIRARLARPSQGAAP